MIDDYFEKYLNERIKDIFKNADTIAPNFDANELDGFNYKNGDVTRWWFKDSFKSIIKKKDGFKELEGAKNKFGIYIAPPVYDDVEWLGEGKLKVMSKKNGQKKYSCITDSGEELFKDGLDYLGDFHDGFAPAEDNGVYFFIDAEGNRYHEGEFDKIFEFKNGFAIVQKGDKFNYLNKEMNLVCDEWYDQVVNFSEGYAIVSNKDPEASEKNHFPTYGWYVISTDGKKIGDKHLGWDAFRQRSPFKNGYIILDGPHDYQYIRKDGIDPFGRYFGEAGSFENGIAHVSTGGNTWSTTHNDMCLFEDGKIVSPKDAIELENIDKKEISIDGYIWDTLHSEKNFRYIPIKKHGDYVLIHGEWTWINCKNYYDTVEKKIVFDEWFAERYNERRGCAECVTNNKGKYNFFNKETGELVFDKWLDKVNDVEHIICRDGKYSLFFSDGKPNKWFDYIKYIKSSGYYLVRQGKVWNIMDSYENLLLDEWSLTPVDIETIYEAYSPNFVSIKKSVLPDFRFHDSMPFTRQLYCKTKDLNNYVVSKSMSKYTCSNGEDSFDIQYEPVVIYDSNNVLCVRKDNSVPNKREAELCLFNRKDQSYRRIGSISECRFLKNMIFDGKNQKVFMVYDGKVLDISDYYKKNLVNKESMYIRENVHILSKEEFEEKLKEASSILYENLKQGKNTVEFFIEMRKQLDKIAEKDGVIPKIDIGKYLLVDRDGHTEIRKEIIDSGLIKYIDLSKFKPDDITTENIDISGVKLDNMTLNTDFSGLDIRGTEEILENHSKGRG